MTVAVGDSGEDSATEGTDYTTVDDLTVTIRAGETSGEGTFEFAVTDDTVADPGETVTVSGTTTAAGFTTITSATLAINDTDTAPTEIVLSLSPTEVTEGDTGIVTITATLSPASVTLTADTVVTVTLAGTTATTGTDFTVGNNVIVTIVAGETSGTSVTAFQALDDTLVEGPETVTVSGTTTAAGFTTITSTTLTIIDGDTAPTAIVLSLSPTEVTEGDTATVTVTAAFPPGSATLAGDTMVTVSVAGTTATVGTDFSAVSGFMVIIAAGMTSGTNTFDLVTTEDTVTEPDETLTVSATAAASFGTITPVTLTIIDDDTAGVTISPTALEVTEGGEQTYTVVLVTEPTGTVVVAIDEGSGATAPITVSDLSLSFSPTTWSAAQTVTVTATEDDDAIGGIRTPGAYGHRLWDRNR